MTINQIDIDTMPGDEARALVHRLEDHIDRNTPMGTATRKTFETIAAAIGGYWPEDAAGILGIDLDRATMLDARSLSWFYGKHMGVRA